MYTKDAYIEIYGLCDCKIYKFCILSITLIYIFTYINKACYYIVFINMREELFIIIIIKTVVFLLYFTYFLSIVTNESILIMIVIISYIP